MGWSSPAMDNRHQHFMDVIRRDVTRQHGGLLWDPAEKMPGEGEDGRAGAAGQA